MLPTIIGSSTILRLRAKTFLFSYLHLRLLYKKSRIDEENITEKCINAFQSYLKKIDPKDNGNFEKKNSQPFSNKEREGNAENRMRYQFLAQQIDNYKSQQWSMTYYALLVFAGIVGITTILHKELCGKDYLIYLGIILAIILTFILAFVISILSLLGSVRKV